MIKRAQSAIEFIILVGAVVFFFLAFIYAVQINTYDELRKNRDLFALEIALTVQNEVSLASESLDGYYRDFEIPLDILGAEYTILIDEGLVYITTTDGKHALALPVVNVTVTTVIVGTNRIRKDGGKVYLNFP